MNDSIKVAKPPIDRPVLMYDGECNFCCRWVARWHSLTGVKVEYVTFQGAREKRFPEISQESCENAIQYIDSEGNVYTSANAIYRALNFASGKRWMHSLYLQSSLFAGISEFAYKTVAQNRYLFSLITKCFWGKNVQPSTFNYSSWLFIRLFGVVCLCAFLSYWTQAQGLVGSDGILPFAEYLNKSGDYLENNKPDVSKFSQLPTLFWLDTNDSFLHLIFAIGTGASLLLIAGICPALSAAVIWITYLSLMIVGQLFLSFQWDILLIETSFLLIFFAPWKFYDSLEKRPKISTLSRLLIWFLLFRLMFESGMVKIQSFNAIDGSNTWLDLTALNYHYWSQPLPSWISWYINQMPDWIHQSSIIIMLVIELILPFFFFAPRRLRNFAVLSQVILQVVIIFTGNYGYFNILTILLCLTLIDDQSLPQSIIRKYNIFLIGDYVPKIRNILKNTALFPISLLIVTVGIVQIWQSCEDSRETRKSSIWLDEHKSLKNFKMSLQRFHVVNPYGLFRVMTKTRPEIILFGSNDEKEWIPYLFNYKPVLQDVRPKFFIMHMPRLDWQMWFAGLQFEGSQRLPYWLVRFISLLIREDPIDMGLLKSNPFPDVPPKFFKVEFYNYTFTNQQERQLTGDWWNRELLNQYTITLKTNNKN